MLLVLWQGHATLLGESANNGRIRLMSTLYMYTCIYGLLFQWVGILVYDKAGSVIYNNNNNNIYSGT